MKRTIFIDGQEYSRIESNEQFKSLMKSNFKKGFLEPVVENLNEIFNFLK